jgi:two-component system, OmpR family, response regulator
MAKLLLVEDDPRIAGFIERGLAAEGHTVDIAGTGTEGLKMARRGDYALMILDRMLPDFDGVEVCRQLRLEGAGTRVLMLTAKDALGDKVGGLRAGADDYLTKPFSFDEFVARIEALLRRSELHRHEPELRVADLTLDPATRRVARGDRVIDLTPKEYALLRYLMENAGTVLSRSQILNNNWGYGFDPGTKVVDVYIRYLRKKIDEGEATPLIHTIRGAGYSVGDRDH